VAASPRWATERTGRESYGSNVAEVALALGFELLDWQRLVVDVALEHDDDGRLVYREVGVSVPRQCGKSTLVLCLLVWRMLAARQELLYGAQSRLAARQKLLDDWWPVIARSKLGSRFNVTRGTGMEGLRASNRSVCRVISTDEAAGHGSTIDGAVLDEAWAYPDASAEQAARPAMVTRPQGQLWVLSTAGTSRSTYWHGKVDVGRAAVEAEETSGLAFFEWSADPVLDIRDPATWRQSHPALGATIDEQTITADIKGMSTAEAARAYGNRRPGDADDFGWKVFSREEFEALVLP
jgi:phage terminase large subunit-like protein